MIALMANTRPRSEDAVVTRRDTRMLDGLALERLLAERVLSSGTVKSVDSAQGRGTIGPDEGDEDLEFWSAESFSVGVRVAFEVDVGQHGLQAFNVTKLPPR